MSQPARAGREQPVSRTAVVDAALRLIEDNDVAALTMRRLAAELGTAVTAIYWHVGNRETLLDLLVDRLFEDMGSVRARGRTPRARIVSVVRQWRARLWDRPHLIGLVHERGKTAAMFQPIQAALAAELAAVGMRGEPAALAVRTLQIHVVASVVLERTAERGPTASVTDPQAWPNAAGDPALIAALSEPMDYQAVFELGLDALLDRLLMPPSGRAGDDTG